jgi:hypothetical protein
VKLKVADWSKRWTFIYKSKTKHESQNLETAQSNKNVLQSWNSEEHWLDLSRVESCLSLSIASETGHSFQILHLLQYLIH